MEQQLAERPPADRLLALYFEAQKWWSPPARGDGEADIEGEEPEIWESPYPDETE